MEIYVHWAIIIYFSFVFLRMTYLLLKVNKYEDLIEINPKYKTTIEKGELNHIPIKDIEKISVRIFRAFTAIWLIVSASAVMYFILPYLEY